MSLFGPTRISKELPIHIVQHQIELDITILPSHKNRDQMNPNHAIMVKQNLDKLLIAWFIVMVEEVIWLLPIVMVPKKFDKLCICVNFRKLNAIMKKDSYRLRFTGEVLDMVVGHKVYSFLGGFSSYHQIMITLEDQYKTIFIV